MPPVVFTAALPVVLPKQPTLVCALMFAPSAAGWVSVMLVLVLQPFASVMFKLYVPACKPLRSILLLAKAPGPFQVIEYGAVPPVMVPSILPVKAPLHAMFVPPIAVGELVDAINAPGSFRV